MQSIGNEEKKICILIVNYNTGELLRRCIDSVKKSRGKYIVEIFVADNNSTDGSTKIINEEFPEVHLEKHGVNNGFTSAINALFRAAKGDYYLILHPDIELRPDTITQFLDFFSRHEEAGVLGGNLYYPDGAPNPCEIMFPGLKQELVGLGMRGLSRLNHGGRLFSHRNAMEWSHEKTESVNWVWNACMIVRKEVIEQVGFFDEGFFVWFADWDFCQRARQEGWDVYYVVDAKAVHHERRSSRYLSPMNQTQYKVDGWYSVAGQMRDRSRFLRKHVGLVSRLGAKAVVFVEYAVKCCLIIGKSFFQKDEIDDTRMQLKACLKTLQSIFVL